jgi:hypothetical protein
VLNHATHGMTLILFLSDCRNTSRIGLQCVIIRCVGAQSAVRSSLVSWLHERVN